MLSEVRAPLLREACQSPALLSDLAGLEQYVAESYSARSFIELLQNADDAQARRFLIEAIGEVLLVANDGRYFTPDDLESLCRSAVSRKHRGDTIGYRGIGFKSVVSFASKVHLFSGPLETTFSRELTRREVPNADKVPLVRIPHPVDKEIRDEIGPSLRVIGADGFKTIFVFADLVANAIETEFASFDPTSLLFLKHVQAIDLRGEKRIGFSVRRNTRQEGVDVVTLHSGESRSVWVVHHYKGVALAFGMGKEGVSRLDERDSLMHAFLPTQEQTGFGIKINGDISTDPSRSRVVLDDRTARCIELSAEYIVSLVRGALHSADCAEASRLLCALVPRADARLTAFQRPSFERDLVQAVLRHGEPHFQELRLRPSWFRTAADFEQLASEVALPHLSHHLEGVEGLTAFLKALGAREARLDEISEALSCVDISVAGAADVVARICGLHATGQRTSKEISLSWKVWPVDRHVLDLHTASKTGTALKQDFLDMVREREGTLSNLRRLLTELLSTSAAFTLIPDVQDRSDQGSAYKPPLRSPQQGLGVDARHIHLRKWRTAEQQVLQLLVAAGWELVDVSKQNLGYDLEGRNRGGETAYVEVKSLGRIGEPFIMTTNERAVANEKGSAYYIALVHQTGRELHLCLIRDPVSKLEMTRQCRHWVWFCDDYQFDSEGFPLR